MISWIPEGHVAIMEFFGKFCGIQEAGFYAYVPGIYTTKYVPSWKNVANKQGYLIEKSEQQTNTPTRYCQTRDNVTLKANTSIGWRIIDPQKAVYATDHLPTMISDLALNSLRANIGRLSLNEIFSSRSELSQSINKELAETVSNWGIQLCRVEIQELTYTEEVAKAMMKEMVADREKKAKILSAQGDAEAALTKARAQADASDIQAKSYANVKIIEAEAEAKAVAIKASAERNYLAELKKEVSEEEAAKILDREKNRECVQTITQNPAHKVFLPNDSQTMLHV